MKKKISRINFIRVLFFLGFYYSTFLYGQTNTLYLCEEAKILDLNAETEGYSYQAAYSSGFEVWTGTDVISGDISGTSYTFNIYAASYGSTSFRADLKINGSIVASTTFTANSTTFLPYGGTTTGIDPSLSGTSTVTLEIYHTGGDMGVILWGDFGTDDSYVILPPSVIEQINVTSPNGGEDWQVGSSHNITWTSSGTSGNVHIEYSTNNGSDWSDVIASTADDGTHSWTIPDAPSGNCLVRVSDTDGDPSDVSDAVFTISTVPYIIVSSPNGGEDWQAGSSHDITWTSIGTSGNVEIEYSTNNGSSWTQEVASTVDDGSYSWTIPDAPSGNCLVRVSDTDGSPSDVSDAVFTISTVPYIIVSSPNGDEDWQVGSSHNITWTSSGTSGNVHIEYSTNNGSDWSDVIASTLDDGTHYWTVPDAPSGNCLVRISDTDGSPSDESDAVFTISDIAGPAIVSVTPSQNALNVTKSTNISVTFDQDMNSSTINASTSIIHSSQTGLHTGNYNYNTGTKTATFDPDDNFTVGEIVTVILTTDIENTTGDTLTNSYEWSFTTEVDGGSSVFQTKTDYPAGDAPSFLFSSDLDSDGDMDLAVANYESDNISIFLNYGDGTFAPKTDYTAGDGPYSVFSSDLDLNGDMDLAITNRNSDNVSILLNNGDGTFGPKADYTVGVHPFCVFSSDLDGDGDMDLTMANYESDNISILLNNGDGTFAPKTDYTTGDGPYFVFSSDLDSDGDMDLAVSNRNSNNVSVLLNNGNGTFAPKTDYAVGIYPYSVFSSDLDNDGDMDLVVANRDNDNVSILLNYGNGTFAPKTDYTAGDEPWSIFISDLDNDGDMDLTVTNYNSENVSVFLNNSEGTFASKIDYGTGSYPRCVFSSDFDNDGDIDLAVANLNSDNISILLNRNKTADISLSTDSLKFGNIEIDSTETLQFTVYNNGVDNTLQITNISSSNSVFVPGSTSESVLPGDSVIITVDFTPTAKITYSDSLTIFSNDPNDPQVTLYVTGVGIDTISPEIPQNLTATPNDQQITLRWNQNNEPDLHKYNIYRDTSSPAGTLIDSVVAFSLPDTFYVDTELTNGQEYFYRITAVDSSNNESGFSDEVSETPFVAPSITVTSPNGGENWQVGSSHDITWTSSGTSGNVEIEYSTNNGSSWTQEVASTVDDGSYSWTIPDAPSGNCLVRVSDTDGDPSDVSDAVFTISTVPYITVSSPNGGEDWQVGSSHDITWTSIGTSGTVNIECSTNNGSDWTSVIASTSDDGTHPWTVPDAPSGECLVRVSDTDGSPSDQSDAVFTISSVPFITVTSPNGGEDWEVSSNHDITWTSNGTSGNVRIEYSTNNGSSWTDVIASTPDDGTHSWTIPDSPSGNCLVRVSDTDGSPSDVSDGVFTISSVPYITVSSPNGGENWQVGSSHDVTWTSSGTSGNVHIEYSTNNGSDWTDIIASTPDDGTHSWTIPDANSENCLVKISDTDGNPSDVSDAVFKMFPPYITVVSPNGGEIWHRGSNHDITWNSTGTSGNVHIEYSTNNGSDWTDIIASTPDDGTHSWTIPDANSENCLVKIGDTDGSPSDVSDAVFTISPPYITVVSPNGGEDWYVGSGYNIAWTSSGTSGNVKIEYSTNNGSSWSDLIVSTPDDGTHSWTIPDAPSENCLMRVRDTDGSPSDESDAVFTISPVPYVTVTSPNGGEDWEVGSSHDITWTSSGTSGNVHIEYSTNNGSSWSDVIASTPDDGTHSWTIPDVNSENCLVRVSDTDGSPTDESDAVFTISENLLPIDSLALVALYDSTNGDNWTNNTNWKSGPVSTWYGVTVTNGRVTELDLDNNNLVGIIPTSIGNLDSLTRLKLNWNALTGAIPPEIGNLSSLINLDLGDNQLLGSIPSELGNISGLRFLWLHNNQLSGVVPNSIYNLTNLNMLWLGGNQFTGTIPSEIGNLNNLIEFTIYSCQFSGVIPAEIGNLTNLITLRLETNQLTGSIPPEIGNLTNLTYLDLENNQFSGVIPVEIGNLMNLTTLDMDDNQLTGLIPAEICSLTNLRNLTLFGNQLTGSIPPEIGNLMSLTTLDMGRNQLTGSIPPEFASLTNLERLNLEGNQLTGSVPGIDSLTKLFSLLLNDNYLIDLPPLAPLSSLEYLRIEDNKFTFEDIEPNIGVPDSEFIYSPQDSVGEAQDTTVSEGSSLTISVSVGGASNQYQWKRDGSAIPGATDSSYLISSADTNDAGSYICEITNTVATELTLYSGSVNVTVSSSAVPIPKLPEVYSMTVRGITSGNMLEVKYALPEKADVRFRVYDIKGTKIKEFSEEKPAGFYSKNIDMNNKPAGVYFVRMEANGKKFTKIRKVVFVR